MKERNGPIRKEIISLMSQIIREKSVDLDRMVFEDEQAATEFIHDQYDIAEEILKTQSQSVRRK